MLLHSIFIFIDSPFGLHCISPPLCLASYKSLQSCRNCSHGLSCKELTSAGDRHSALDSGHVALSWRAFRTLSSTRIRVRPAQLQWRPPTWTVLLCAKSLHCIPLLRAGRICPRRLLCRKLRRLHLHCIPTSSRLLLLTLCKNTTKLVRLMIG